MFLGTSPSRGISHPIFLVEPLQVGDFTYFFFYQYYIKTLLVYMTNPPPKHLILNLVLLLHNASLTTILPIYSFPLTSHKIVVLWYLYFYLPWSLTNYIDCLLLSWSTVYIATYIHINITKVHHTQHKLLLRCTSTIYALSIYISM